MTRSNRRGLLAGFSSLAISLASTDHVWAAGETSTQEGGAASEIIVTGTRQTGVKAADSAAPIQVVNAAALSQGGQPNLILSLARSLPSFNAQALGGDTANLTLSAALRGISPNDTLVLVNGKRRHGTGNLAVDGGSPYQGSATTDLSLIPVDAIDHVEVLQDGAAAQYGSDAIAGVVNIILKSSDHGGALTGTAGQYDQNGGATGAWSLNKGFALGDEGYLNVTAEERYHNFSQQGTYDRRYYTQNGTLLSTLSAVNAAGVPDNPNAPRVNQIAGDAAYNVYNLFYDAGYNLTSAVQAYSFGSFGHRNAESFENYRPPSQVSAATSTGAIVYPFPTGFSPREALNENDFSGTVGVKGSSGAWNWDLSSTYGEDRDDISTIDSANANLFTALQSLSATPIVAQTSFYDGSFINREWTSNLDINRSFDIGLTKPLNLAFGVEGRSNSFTIEHGDAASSYGSGASSYPGFLAVDAGTHSRTNYAGYVDVAVVPLSGLQVDGAGRYEHYSDFGSATVGKLTARYDFGPAFALRGTVSNGFRAPTLAEEYYSATNVSPTSASVQLPADSAAAKAAGFSSLKPEKSDNYSLGFVAHPLAKLQVTADLYEIDIHDRILGSGTLLGSSGSAVVSQQVLDAIAAHGTILPAGVTYTGVEVFTNAADTRTRGAEVTASYPANFRDYGHVDWSLGLNYNETTITKLAALPALLVNTAYSQTKILTPLAESALTTATPRVKAVLGANWSRLKWSVDLDETIYGPASLVVSTSGTGVGGLKETIGTTAITNLDIGYHITPAFKLDVGANNLFNTFPPSRPNVLSNGVLAPADGSSIYGAPIGFSPFGINGGYYYGRVTYAF